MQRLDSIICPQLNIFCIECSDVQYLLNILLLLILVYVHG